MVKKDMDNIVFDPPSLQLTTSTTTVYLPPAEVILDLDVLEDVVFEEDTTNFPSTTTAAPTTTQPPRARPPRVRYVPAVTTTQRSDPVYEVTYYTVVCIGRNGTNCTKMYNLLQTIELRFVNQCNASSRKMRMFKIT